MNKTQTKTETIPPSHFAKLGKPYCSPEGKSEFEDLALAYVRALKNLGDEWRQITPRQAAQALKSQERDDAAPYLRYAIEEIDDGALLKYGIWWESMNDLGEKFARETWRIKG